MRELTIFEQEDLVGGAVIDWVIYALLGAALYKVWVTSRGRISIPRLISIEWRG